jgi:hypothetical protein
MPATTAGRSYTAGRFGLTIDGTKVSAYIKAVEGGFVKGNLTDEAIGPDLLHVKHLATREIEPFSVEVGLSGCRTILTWIQDSWKKQFSRRNGEVAHGDFDLNTMFEHQFRNALIMETAFPGLDGTSKEAGYLKVKFWPEAIETKKVRSSRLMAEVSPNQKMWLNSAFSMRIDGVDMKKVNKIEPFIIKQGVKPIFSGRELLPELEPTKIEFPDISCHMAVEHAASLMAWYDEFVRNGGKAEKTGAIEFLTPDRNTTIFTVELRQVGIRNFTISRSEGAQTAIKRAKADFYVGEMEIKPGPGLS